MSYDAHDFVSSICDALGVEEAYSESDSADRCLEAIEALKRQAKHAPVRHRALKGLLDWERQMGGWEAPAWRNAKRALRGRAPIEEGEGN